MSTFVAAGQLLSLTSYGGVTKKVHLNLTATGAFFALCHTNLLGLNSSKEESIKNTECFPLSRPFSRNQQGRPQEL
jgi:hypothetical protein